ncbi:MAG: dephospho-CoA kinase [Bacteroidota bacterium]|jgi:dephospho-CoA kinase|nr:dephospho-CoA kinase [Bacteroidota bacterium]
MKIIGITGGIGSGKSTVCRVFQLLGVPVYYADEESKLLLNDPVILSKLSDAFGPEIIADGKADRKKISSIVFNDKQKLDTLNKIVHPAVKEHFEEWCRKNSASDYVIKEAAILFESETYKFVQKIITVTAPEALKIERVMQRDGVSEEDVRRRMLNQISDEEKIKRSDYVLMNDEKELLIPQVIELNGNLKVSFTTKTQSS